LSKHTKSYRTSPRGYTFLLSVQRNGKAIQGNLEIKLEVRVVINKGKKAVGIQ
jgi:hypothetical protein